MRWPPASWSAEPPTPAPQPHIDDIGLVAGTRCDAVQTVRPLKRVATGEDIAAACHFLCSDEAGYITGAQINVNGGVYM